jgi:phosphomannomutase
MTGIFHAYDIRGVFPSELNEEIAYRVGRAFVTFLKTKSVVVGRDARISSNKLYHSLIKGINDQGANVINIGLCTTPLFYFASRKAQSSIMVTASHLPKQFNGFKLCREKAIPISGKDGLKQIEKLVDNNKFKTQQKKGKVSHKNPLEEFIRFNHKFFKKNNQESINKKIKVIKIVLDSGNGMSGYTFPKVVKTLNSIKLIVQYPKIDFSFPNHVPNPLKFFTLKDLQKRIIKERADFGLSTDGDGDRCTFVDETGKIISPDIATALLAQQLLKQHPHAKIMYDVRCSKVVKETIEKHGGKAIMSRVGHSFIKSKMRLNKVIFAGELSGHMYYSANNFTESPIISTALITNLLNETGQSLSSLVKPLRKYYHSGEINRKVKDKEKIIKTIEKKYKQKAQKTLHLDGLSMYFKDWWFSLRTSHTEDLLRLNLEANSNKLMQKKKQEILRIIKS